MQREFEAFLWDIEQSAGDIDIAHRYHLVKSELVWDIIENDLRPLLERIRSLLSPTHSGSNI